jgi:predicted branched-subunit amino acid permease
MRRILPNYERLSDPVLPLHHFRRRLAHSATIAVGLVVISLSIGMLGYRGLEGLSWPDAFLDASMLLGGMGPVHSPQTLAGKLFAGVYALYCGLVVIALAGILLAPVAHRMLHKFHAETDDDTSGN